MTERENGAEGRGSGEPSDTPDPSRTLAEAEARRALDAYPTLVSAGVAYTCLESVDGRWRILATGLEEPQQARNHLAHLFLVAMGQAGDEAEREEFRAAADLLDRERHDELTVAGRLFRIGRIERSVRVGPDGPEPPRPTDPDQPPGERDTVPSRSLGFIDANALSGTAAAVLRYQLHNSVADSTTDEAREEARLALATHPRLVLLPVEFAVAEEVDGRWRPRFAQSEVTPQAARDRLASYLRPPRLGRDVDDPELRREYAELQEWIDSRRPGPEVCAEWAKAADLVERERLNDIRTAGYHFRIMRVDQIVRVGPEGPERPRPTDPDPYDPPAAIMQGIEPDEPDEDG